MKRKLRIFLLVATFVVCGLSHAQSPAADDKSCGGWWAKNIWSWPKHGQPEESWVTCHAGEAEIYARVPDSFSSEGYEVVRWSTDKKLEAADSQYTTYLLFKNHEYVKSYTHDELDAVLAPYANNERAAAQKEAEAERQQRDQSEQIAKETAAKEADQAHRAEMDAIRALKNQKKPVFQVTKVESSPRADLIAAGVAADSLMATFAPTRSIAIRIVQVSDEPVVIEKVTFNNSSAKGCVFPASISKLGAILNLSTSDCPGEVVTVEIYTQRGNLRIRLR